MNTLRHPRSVRVLSVRPMTPADLEGLRRPSNIPRLRQLRDSHHNVARMLASGMKVYEVAARCGYSLKRVSDLQRDPAFIDLVARYRDEVTEVWKESVDDFMTLATANMIKAERQISDRLDEADEKNETLPVRELIAISRDAADRLGYGKKSTTLNLNVDFAAKLEAARRRSKPAIEGVTHVKDAAE